MSPGVLMSKAHSSHPTIGRKIRRFRQERGLSLSDLSARIGVSKGLISRWENQGADPDYGQTEKLASAFGIPVAWLWSPDPLPPDYSSSRH